jgi:hypothetical protein
VFIPLIVTINPQSIKALTLRRPDITRQSFDNVYLSSNHFEPVDLLGQDYLSAIRTVVTIDYPFETVMVLIK